MIFCPNNLRLEELFFTSAAGYGGGPLAGSPQGCSQVCAVLGGGSCGGNYSADFLEELKGRRN